MAQSPISQRNKAVERAVGVEVGGDKVGKLDKI